MSTRPNRFSNFFLSISLLGIATVAGIFIVQKFSGVNTIGPESSKASTQCTKDSQCKYWEFCNNSMCQNINLWSKNGPTAAFTTKDGLNTVICNMQLCWIYNPSTKTLLSSGAPISLKNVSPWKDIKPVGNVSLWSGNGPTTGWERTDGVTVICNKKVCWDFNRTTQNFNNSGVGYEISSTEAWRKSEVKKSSDNNYPWSGSGIDFSITMASKGESWLCNSGDCWIQKMTGSVMSWANGGVAFNMSKDLCPSSTGKCTGSLLTNIFASTGPTTGWSVEDGGQILCNKDKCIEIKSTAGDVTEVKLDTDSRFKDAKPYTPTEAELNATPTPTGSDKPKETDEPAGEIGDFDKSGKVDIKDFSEFSNLYGKGKNKADLNGNDKVGIDDFIVFREEYLSDNKE